MNKEIRQLFPITQQYVYLNHAAVAPYSTLVANAIHNITTDITEHGSVHWSNWLATVNEVRHNIARLVNTQAANIAFVRNTSDGISIAANGLAWQPGDNVVSCNIEFPANIYPWMRLAEQGVELRLAPAQNGRIEPEALFALVDSRTRVIALSWVQFASGYRADLKTIGQFCRDKDLLFCVDAIQGLGALQLDVEADLVDTFAADTHKFLMGPEGVGVLYLSDRALARIKPSVVGWMSVKDWWNCFDPQFDYKLDYQPTATRFECGTLNTIGLYGANAAVKLMLEVGAAQIEEYLLNLSEYLRTGLAELGFELVGGQQRQELSAIVCGRPPKQNPEQLYHQLVKENIICAPRGGCLRISPHFYNDQTDIDRLLKALATIISQG